MIQNRVIPCLLLKDNGLVKTIQFKKPKYVGDPLNVIKLFNDKEVDELVILDITSTKENKDPNFELIKEIASECFMPLGYGGGINSISHIEKLFNIGIEKIILNSITFKDVELIKTAISIFGSQSIIVSIDVKKNWFSKKEFVYSHGGTINTGIKAIEHAKNMEKLGVGEIIINSIDKDGMMNGYDLNLIKEVSSNINIPIVALGGAGELNDLKKARDNGADGLGAGSLFIYQKMHKAVLVTYPTQEEIKKIFN